jgi:hypothetical protein
MPTGVRIIYHWHVHLPSHFVEYLCYDAEAIVLALVLLLFLYLLWLARTYENCFKVL